MGSVVVVVVVVVVAVVVVVVVVIVVAVVIVVVVCCCCCHCLLLETANSNNVSQGVQTLNGNKPVYRYESNSGGEREIQRTMLELLNQLDGFDSRGDVKVNIIVVDILHLLKACVQLCLIY